MPGLVNRSKALGWTGIEGLAGVPGSLGGGVAMNAGGSWGDMWDVVDRVRVLEPDGSVADLPRESFSPSYRNANLGPRIVLAASLRLEQSTKQAVEGKVREHLEHKRRVQPVTEWSAGCIFKNPPKERSNGKSAGQLIDECGLKGTTRGDAIVSPLHGNFLVNRGRATATDVLALIDEVRARVADRTGILLEREVKVWGAG
jgi:UDP-N-acetylmuramate dehydrogenase